MNFARGKLIPILVLFLTAASCGNSNPSRVDNVAIGVSVNPDNRVQTEIEAVPSSTPTIYLSGRVVGPTANTEVRVAWSRLDTGIIATESFDGTRGNGDLFNFDKSVTGSYFASQINREGIGWEQGEYKADVFLNGQRVTSRFFKVVTDSEADNINNSAKVRSVTFGSQLSSNNQIQTSQTSFSRNTDHIYTQINLNGSQPGTRIEARVRYLRQNLVVNNFTATAGQEQFILFDLPLSRFNILWSDRLWASGGYEVEIMVDGSTISTESFIVE